MGEGRPSSGPRPGLPGVSVHCWHGTDDGEQQSRSGSDGQSHGRELLSSLQAEVAAESGAGAMANGTRTMADVVIVGGGVIGCATAYYLAEQGVRVALIEQQRIGGPPSASAASAAILEALAGSPQPLALQAQLARRLLAELAPQLRDLTGIDIELQQL